MLTKTHLFFTHHAQAAINSFHLLYKRPVANCMTIIVIAIALALPAIFWVFADNFSQLTTDWQRGGHISLYLKPGISEIQQKKLLETVRKTQGVEKADLKSSAAGLAELSKQEGMQDIMRYLPENPLPAVIDVLPTMLENSPAKLDLLTRNLRALPRVDQAKLDMEWISRLHAILGFIAKVAKALMVLLAMAVVLIIGTTLRLAIQSRQEEIQILKLIGASDPYIIRPFLYSGVWYGVAGALLAILIVNLILLSVGAAVNQLIVAYQMHYRLVGLSIRQILILLFFAIILGWLAARLSVRRQLASIEPYN